MMRAMGLMRVVVVVAALVAGGCAPLTLAWTALTPQGPAAAPPALGGGPNGDAVASVERWERARAPVLRDALETYVYGAMPDSHALEVTSRRVLDERAFGGRARLYEYVLQADVRFGDETRKTRPFAMNLVAPRDNPDAPVILMQTFCPRWNAIPHPAIPRPDDARDCGDGFLSGVMTYVFGRYIATPPLEEILDRGYAVAAVYPSEFAPDNGEAGLATLNQLAAGVDDEKRRWGAIAAWGWGYSLMIDALEREPDLSTSAYVAYGHSRYGKSALVAAAFDPRVSAVVSHQSGAGGASLNRGKKGESVKSITRSYPHWFAPRYAEFAGREEAMPVDQHHLLALIAPRPVLLGNARRDVWSDPNGAFRAAMGADPVYRLYGAGGLEQARLDEWRPHAPLAFWLRPGTHGVVEEDWPAFLEFLDAHLNGAGPALEAAAR